MSNKDERANAVAEAIAEIQALLAAGVSSARLDAAKQVLMRLAERHELFNHDAFPLPTDGRFERSYRYTVVDTIGGGASEIQKNIIGRRGLGLPPNF